jgi:hypothetical protein
MLILVHTNDLRVPFTSIAGEVAIKRAEPGRRDEADDEAKAAPRPRAEEVRRPRDMANRVSENAR